MQVHWYNRVHRRVKASGLKTTRLGGTKATWVGDKDEMQEQGETAVADGPTWQCSARWPSSELKTTSKQRGSNPAAIPGISNGGQAPRPGGLPGSLAVPSTVYVLPEEVTPVQKRSPLLPWITSCSSD